MTTRKTPKQNGDIKNHGQRRGLARFTPACSTYECGQVATHASGASKSWILKRIKRPCSRLLEEKVCLCFCMPTSVGIPAAGIDVSRCSHEHSLELKFINDIAPASARKLLKGYFRPAISENSAEISAQGCGAQNSVSGLKCDLN